MGLNVSHDAWTGAYGAFGRWRQHLAEVAGYAVAKVQWLPADAWDGPRDTVLIDWGHITKANRQGEWTEAERPKDPLIYLIAHSDCDGVIHPVEAALLADRLQELLPLLDESKSGGHIQSMRQKTGQFIAGLRDAVSRDETVEFW